MQRPIGIIGLGVVGGSLAKALVLHGERVVAVDPSSATTEAARADGIEAALAMDERLLACRIVVIATPLNALPDLLTALGPFLASDVILSDVIGVKVAVEEAMSSRLPRVHFVGAHPMAGGELHGYAHARAELFVGKTVAICPPSPDDEDHAQEIAALWQTVGAEPVFVSAEDHDRAVAATSHVPYLSALALVRLAAANETTAHIAGKGFFDATRRAAFAPEVMAAVVARNSFVPAALRTQATELVRLAELIETKPDTLLEEAEAVQALRRTLGAPQA